MAYASRWIEYKAPSTQAYKTVSSYIKPVESISHLTLSASIPSLLENRYASNISLSTIWLFVYAAELQYRLIISMAT